MTEHKEIPEGVQVAIEILQNIPEPMLDDFLEELMYGTPLIRIAPSKLDVWKKVVKKWYGFK